MKYTVYIPSDIFNLRANNDAKNLVDWLEKTRKLRENEDFRWLTWLFGPHKGTISFEFNDANEAMLFKLTWGGK